MKRRTFLKGVGILALAPAPFVAARRASVLMRRSSYRARSEAATQMEAVDLSPCEPVDKMQAL